MRQADPPALFIARSKTDQEGRGRWCAISEATGAAIAAWLEAARLAKADPLTPLFLPLTKAGGLAPHRVALSGKALNRPRRGFEKEARLPGKRHA